MVEKRIIPGTFYEVDIFGEELRSISRTVNGRFHAGRTIKKQVRKIGDREYYYYPLKINGKYTQKGMHQLVAMAFPDICGEYFEGCHVHHIDKNTTNNSAYNLKVMSKKEHEEIHKYDTSKGKGVYKYNLEWVFIERFDNARQAAASVCGSLASLQQALNLHKTKTSYYKGFYWLYE